MKRGSNAASGPAGTISHGSPVRPPKPTSFSRCLPRTSATIVTDFDPSLFAVTGETESAVCASSLRPDIVQRFPRPTSFELGAR